MSADPAPPAGPTLARSAVDRAASRRSDDAWLQEAWSLGRLLVVDPKGRAAVLDDTPPSLVWSEAGLWEGPQDRLFLGVDAGGRAYWGLQAEPRPAPGTRLLGLREVGDVLGDLDAGLLVTAVALAAWHTSHPRCPLCGSLTETVAAGWARRCPVDGSQHFPRTDPAVIVLLHDGADRVLLGRQPSWPAGRYSTIAGFVEAGESAEQTVHREVGEETGALVTDVRYRASQPWPFPRSLMLGYEARVVGGRIRTPDGELEDVRWFTREQLQRGEAGLPPPSSIAHWLITTWLARDGEGADPA